MMGFFYRATFNSCHSVHLLQNNKVIYTFSNFPISIIVYTCQFDKI